MRIEIVSLSPNIDLKTGQFSNGLVLCYKTIAGLIENLQLEWTHKEIMDTFNIQNFSDIAHKKVDIEYEDKDWKRKIHKIIPIDDREITYSDFSRLEKSVLDLHAVLRTYMEASKKQPQP